MQNLQECTCTGVLFQPSTCNFIEKRRRHVIFLRKFANFFRNNFIMENLLRTGFEWRISQKIVNRHSYLKNKVKEQTLRGKVYISQIFHF